MHVKHAAVVELGWWKSAECRKKSEELTNQAGRLHDKVEEEVGVGAVVSWPLHATDAWGGRNFLERQRQNQLVGQA